MPASPSLVSVFWRLDEEDGEVSLLWISPDRKVVEDGMEVEEEEEEEDEVGKEGEEEDTEEVDANVESIDIWW